jgi:hypothetical protein
VSWLVLWVSLYLVFLTVFNLYSPVRLPAGPSGTQRFWDLPWFFILMCLMAGAYHWSMVRSSVFLGSEEESEKQRATLRSSVSSEESADEIAHVATINPQSS